MPLSGWPRGKGNLVIFYRGTATGLMRRGFGRLPAMVIRGNQKGNFLLSY